MSISPKKPNKPVEQKPQFLSSEEDNQCFEDLPLSTSKSSSNNRQVNPLSQSQKPSVVLQVNQRSEIPEIYNELNQLKKSQYSSSHSSKQNSTTTKNNIHGHNNGRSSKIAQQQNKMIDIHRKHQRKKSKSSEQQFNRKEQQKQYDEINNVRSNYRGRQSYRGDQMGENKSQWRNNKEKKYNRGFGDQDRSYKRKNRDAFIRNKQWGYQTQKNQTCTYNGEKQRSKNINQKVDTQRLKKKIGNTKNQQSNPKLRRHPKLQNINNPAASPRKQEQYQEKYNKKSTYNNDDSEDSWGNFPKESPSQQSQPQLSQSQSYSSKNKQKLPQNILNQTPINQCQKTISDLYIDLSAIERENKNSASKQEETFQLTNNILNFEESKDKSDAENDEERNKETNILSKEMHEQNDQRNSSPKRQLKTSQQQQSKQESLNSFTIEQYEKLAELIKKGNTSQKNNEPSPQSQDNPSFLPSSFFTSFLLLELRIKTENVKCAQFKQISSPWLFKSQENQQKLKQLLSEHQKYPFIQICPKIKLDIPKPLHHQSQQQQLNQNNPLYNKNLAGLNPNNNEILSKHKLAQVINFQGLYEELQKQSQTNNIHLSKTASKSLDEKLELLIKEQKNLIPNPMMNQLLKIQSVKLYCRICGHKSIKGLPNAQSIKFPCEGKHCENFLKFEIEAYNYINLDSDTEV